MLIKREEKDKKEFFISMAKIIQRLKLANS
jgi:hypothetical protein